MTPQSTPAHPARPWANMRAAVVLLLLLTTASAGGLLFNLIQDGFVRSTFPAIRLAWWVALGLAWLLLWRGYRRLAIFYVFLATVGLATAVAIFNGNISDEPFVLLLIAVVTAGLEAGSRIATACGALAAAGILIIVSLMETGYIDGRTVTTSPEIGEGIFYAMSMGMMTILLVFGLRYGERLLRQIEAMNGTLSTELEERKALSEALRASRAELEAILRSAPVGVVTIDRDDRIVRFDGNLADRFNRPPHSLTSLVTPADLPVVGRRLAELRAGGVEPDPIEVTLRRSDGDELEGRVHFGMVTDAGSDHVVLTIEDVTDQRQVERRLQTHRRHHDMGLIAGRVAHDFDNLMSAVLAHATAATTMARQGRSNLDQLDKLKTGARTAALLTQQLVAYAGNTPQERESVDLAEVIQTTGELFAVTLPPGVELTTIGQKTAPVMADLTQIQQVVMNLVINASQAMSGRRGTVTLTVSDIDLRADEVLEWTIGSNGLQPGRYVRVAVADEGPGIDSDVLTRMWEPFVTTVPGGHGLGLSVVLGIVRSHRGALRVTTARNRGTTIELVLPAAEPVDGAVRPARDRVAYAPIS